MARAIWKGSLAFGLVNIPVELHTAVRDSRPRFRMLHAEDKSPVKFERVCQKDGKPVAWEELVKGYEYEKGRFVVLTKEDLRAAALEKTRTVDIRSFVKPAEIDDRFFETAYYLTPSKGGERAYALLREAIRETGLVGIATVVLRDAQHLAAVEVIDEAMVLTLMRYEEELVEVSEFRFPKRGTAQARAADGADIGGATGRHMGSIAVHGRVPRQSHEDRQGQAERQGSQTHGARRASPGGSRRPDGTAAAIAAGIRRRRTRHEGAEGGKGPEDRRQEEGGRAPISSFFEQAKRRGEDVKGQAPQRGLNYLLPPVSFLLAPDR